MKKFIDLRFYNHFTFPDKGILATCFFDNGYGISLTRFLLFDNQYGSYTKDDTQWEVAVLIGEEGESQLCYTTPITDDVIGYQSQQQVEDLMIKIQELPRRNNHDQ